MNRDSFAYGEWYHCYTRGVDKRKTFTSPADYQRFLDGLFLCNSTERVHRSNVKRGVDVFSLNREGQLVNIAAYCLMPNHFHLLIQEREDGGISSFMQKLGTSYTMYFNKRYERVGNLFVKPFRSRHVHDDSYAKQVCAYIHLNPVTLRVPDWKEVRENKLSPDVTDFIENYQYSSLLAYTKPSSKREQDSILDTSALELFRGYEVNNSVSNLIRHAQDFLSR